MNGPPVRRRKYDTLQDVPGGDIIDKLTLDVMSAPVIKAPVLIDVGFIQDPGMRAVVVLAASLEWNVVHKHDKPVTLISRGGFKHVVPTETSINFNVFRNRVNATVTHSLTAYPAPELMDAIIKMFKLDPSHARVLRDAAYRPEPGPGFFEGLEIPEPGLELIEDATEPEPGPKPEDAPEPVEEPSAVALEPYSERTEPTLNHMGDGKQYLSEIMVTVIRQLERDGDEQITYRCKVCGLEYESKRGCGSHYQRHVQAGEAEPTAKLKRTIVNIVPDYVPTEVHVPRNSEAAELRRLRTILSAVQQAVGMDQIKDAERRVMVAQRKQAEAEAARDAANARADRLAGDLRSLHELIGGLSDD